MSEGNRGSAGDVCMKQLVAAASAIASILTCRRIPFTDGCMPSSILCASMPAVVGMVTCFQRRAHRVPLGCGSFPLGCVPSNPSRGASCCLPHALLPQSLGPHRASLQCASVQSLPGSAHDAPPLAKLPESRQLGLCCPPTPHPRMQRGPCLAPEDVQQLLCGLCHAGPPLGH